MTWLRVDDTALTHPKVLRLRSLEVTGASARSCWHAEDVIGFVMLAATWSGQHLTDCFIPTSLGQLASPSRWKDLAAAAVRVGMLSKPTRGPDGERGWLVNIDDGLFHLMSREEVERNREHRRAGRRDDVKIAVLLRDGDQCRYCGQTVNPKDSRGGRGRTLDHIDPSVAVGPDDLVVSCRGCNRLKTDRTPDQAAMPLLDPPDPARRHLHPATLEWLVNQGALRPDGSQPTDHAPARTASAADDAAASAARAGATGPAATALPSDQPHDQDQDQTGRPPPREVPDHHVPGRAGTELAGGAAGRSRDGPRRRGARGRRGRPPPHSQEAPP